MKKLEKTMERVRSLCMTALLFNSTYNLGYQIVNQIIHKPKNMLELYIKNKNMYIISNYEKNNQASK